MISIRLKALNCELHIEKKCNYTNLDFKNPSLIIVTHFALYTALFCDLIEMLHDLSITACLI